MGSPQTTYNANPAVAVAGMEADAGRGDTISRVAASDLGFGVAVKQHATDGLCDKPSASTSVILGVTVYDAALPPVGSINGAAYPGAYATGQEVRIKRKGRIHVIAEQDVDPTADVYVRHTASGGNTTLGKFRKDADTATALQLTNAKWLSTTAAGGFALLEINIP